MGEEVKIAKTIDVRGEICPYPDMKTMVALAKMAPGEILEVLIDYPLALERIPRSLKKKKHKLLQTEQIDGPDHRLLIEAHGLK